MAEDTVQSLRQLLYAQSKVLARATRKVTELERRLAASPRGPTAGQAEEGGDFAIVQAYGQADTDDQILHLNARHLGSREALARMHAADHAYGGHTPHAHTHVDWSTDDRTQDEAEPASEPGAGIAPGPEDADDAASQTRREGRSRQNGKRDGTGPLARRDWQAEDGAAGPGAGTADPG